MKNCPNCGNLVQPNAAFCDNCGASLAGAVPSRPLASRLASTPAPDGTLVCPTCGAPMIAGQAFCDNCGADITNTPLAMPVPVMAVAAAAPAPASTPAGQPGALACPACGARVSADQVFCDNCGASLAGRGAIGNPAQGATAAAAGGAPAPAGRPHLVVVSSGAQLDLPAKKTLLIGREDPVSGIFPDVDLTPHGAEAGGVSRRHAQMTSQGSQWSIEDLNSTNYTFVNNQKLLPGVPQTLGNGDQIRVGRVVLTFQAA